MDYYFYLSNNHVNTDRLLISWYRDLDCEDVSEFAQRQLHLDLVEWLRSNSPDHCIRAYVIPFTEVKVLVGFKDPGTALMFKLTWL